MTASSSAPRWWCYPLPSVALRLDLACSAEYRVAGRNRIFCDGHHIGIVAACVSTLARRAGRLSDSPNPRAVLTYAEPGTCPAPERGFLFCRQVLQCPGLGRERTPAHQSAINRSRFPWGPSLI